MLRSLLDNPAVRPPIVCLIGSTRFKREFALAIRRESAAGRVVLSVAWFTHADGAAGPEEEDIFKLLHFRKIDMADEVYVIDPGGYVGQSAFEEVVYARERGKPVRWLEDSPRFRMPGEAIDPIPEA
jgi:hypothetical protein